VSKLAIVGSKGYVGSNLKMCLEGQHHIVPFSHSATIDYEGQELCVNSHFSLESLLKFSSDFDAIIFLLESKNLDDRKFIKQYLLELLKSTSCAKVIIFSSVSVFSVIKSQYLEFKLNTIILRPGVIFGGVPGGLYKTFLGIKKKKFLFLPCGDAVTGYVNIKNVSQRILDIIGLKQKDKIQVLIDIPLSLSDAIRFFGFRGKILVIPSQMTLRIFSPFIPLLKHFPTSIQSILTLAAISMPPIEAKNIQSKFIFRKILLTQFIGLNSYMDLKFGLRSFIRELENNNSCYEYLNMSIKQRFIFFKRFSEIYNLSVQK
jgi:hypothetical protein